MNASIAYVADVCQVLRDTFNVTLMKGGALTEHTLSLNRYRVMKRFMVRAGTIAKRKARLCR